MDSDEDILFDPDSPADQELVRTTGAAQDVAPSEQHRAAARKHYDETWWSYRRGIRGKLLSHFLWFVAIGIVAGVATVVFFQPTVPGFENLDPYDQGQVHGSVIGRIAGVFLFLGIILLPITRLMMAIGIFRGLIGLLAILCFLAAIALAVIGFAQPQAGLELIARLDWDSDDAKAMALLTTIPGIALLICYLNSKIIRPERGTEDRLGSYASQLAIDEAERASEPKVTSRRRRRR